MIELQLYDLGFKLQAQELSGLGMTSYVPMLIMPRSFWDGHSPPRFAIAWSPGLSSADCLFQEGLGFSV